MIQPQGGSIWGNINTCIEIALNIYYIYAEHGEGIAISKEKAEAALSEKGVKAGIEEDGFLYYGKDDTMDIPLYEILKKRLETSHRLEEQIIKQMKELEQHGHISLPDYFGECPPPAVEGTVDQVRNGIYFVEYDNTTQFAVEKTVAENFLSPLAFDYGEEKDGYLYYSLDKCAIPLYELKSIFRECQECITSEVNLISTLCERYPYYRDAFNALVSPEEQIPESCAEPGNFIRQQREVEEAPIYEEETAMEEASGLEEYGESVDYGFEP